MIDKAIDPEIISFNDPVPPFHIVQSNDRVQQFTLIVIHIILFRIIQRLWNRICDIRRCDDIGHFEAGIAKNLSAVNPAFELFLAVPLFQPLDLLQNLVSVGMHADLHCRYFIFCHLTDDLTNIGTDI